MTAVRTIAKYGAKILKGNRKPELVVFGVMRNSSCLKVQAAKIPQKQPASSQGHRVSWKIATSQLSTLTLFGRRRPAPRSQQRMRIRLHVRGTVCIKKEM